MSRMHIVGGEWKGRAIESPDGRGVARPTTERTREAIASMVLSAFALDLSDVTVLDAFAGSGAIGLELLSRGAKSCTFVDRDRQMAARVRRNVQTLGASDRSHVLVGDAQKLVERGVAGAPFSLVVLDPPYAMEASWVAQLVERLFASGQLVPGAYVLYERAEKAAALSLSCATVIKEKTRGITGVTLYRMEDALE